MPEAFVLDRDGNQWCAKRSSFINLQESPAGFGDDPHDAMIDLLKQELEAAQATDLNEAATEREAKR